MNRAAWGLAFVGLFLIWGGVAADTKISAVALFKNKAVIKVDGKQRILKAGEESPEGVELLSATSEEATVTFDGAILHLKLDGRIINTFATAPARQIVRVAPGDGGHYTLDGTINGNPVKFIVDTGATSVVMNRNTAEKVGISYEKGQPVAVETASGEAAAYRLDLKEVKVRALGIKNVPGVVIDGDYPTQVLLGQSFLNRIDMKREGPVLELRER
ncbi:MAG: TIGR02281 family clan AA aspartic protease [Pseudomonadota bacterium]